MVQDSPLSGLWFRIHLCQGYGSGFTFVRVMVQDSPLSGLLQFRLSNICISNVKAPFSLGGLCSHCPSPLPLDKIVMKICSELTDAISPANTGHSFAITSPSFWCWNVGSKKVGPGIHCLCMYYKINLQFMALW